VSDSSTFRAFGRERPPMWVGVLLSAPDDKREISAAGSVNGDF
jgi:hypothetical protein